MKVKIKNEKAPRQDSRWPRLVIVGALLLLQLPPAVEASQNDPLALLNHKVLARAALLVDAASGQDTFRLAGILPSRCRPQAPKSC